MTTTYAIGDLNPDEWLSLLGISSASDPKLAAISALSWGGAALKVMRVNATENGWELVAVSTVAEPPITAGTTAQYWRGDKSWQTLDKTAVGLGSVDNTADAAKNVLTATKLFTARNFTITGDGSWTVSFDGSAAVSAALTLATVNSNVGSFGGASKTITATVNGKGLVTAFAEAPIAIAQSQVTNLTSDLALKAPLASPTFTGTVNGASASFTGTVAAGAAFMFGAGNVITLSGNYHIFHNPDGSACFYLGNSSDPSAYLDRDDIYLRSSGGSLRMRIGSLNGGTGVVFIGNAGAVPSSNPAGGGILYVDAGALKFRGSSGTVTTIAPA